MIPRLPNLTLSTTVRLCCLTGAVLMTAACSDSRDKYSPTTDIPDTVEYTPSSSSTSSSSSSTSSSSTGGPVVEDIEVTEGWRAQPDTLNWDYVANGVFYEPTDAEHALVTDLTTPRNFNGAKLSYTIEVDSAFVESGSKLQVLFQQKTDGYPGYWECTFEAEELAESEETHDCLLPATGWNLEHSSGVQVGLQTPGDQEAEPAGTVTILGLTITLPGGDTTPPEPENLMPDPGFEGETLATGWGGTWAGGTLSLSTEEYNTGAQSLRITGRTKTNYGGQFNLTSLVTPGATYDVKAWAKHMNTVPDLLRLNSKVECVDGIADYPLIVELEDIEGDTWTELEGKLNVPDCPLKEVLIYFENTAENIDIFVDDISVMVGEPIVNLVEDGGFEGESTAWTAWQGGVPSLSTAEKVTGEQSLLISGRTITDAGAGYALTSKVASGRTYHVTAMAKHKGEVADVLKISAKVTCDEADSYPPVAEVTDAEADTWTKLEGDLVIPECTTVGEARIYFESTAAEVDIYVDDVVVVAVPEPDAEPQNLVLNGDFETDMTGWDSFGNDAVLSVSGEQSHSGEQSLKATGRAGTDGYAGYDLTDAVTRGTTYAVSAWLRHTGPEEDVLRAASVVTCTEETKPEEHSNFPWINNLTGVAPNTWTRLSGNLPIADCDLTEVKLYFEGTSEGVDVYIDDVSVTEAPAD